MNHHTLKKFLDKKVDAYNQPFFITDDPISIPHRFSKKQDIEIAGFLHPYWHGVTVKASSLPVTG